MTPAAALEDGYESSASPKDYDYLNRARQAFRSSDDWFDKSLRHEIEKDIDLFHSRHPAGSKYHDESYGKRSQLFRPKTRAAVRKLEAAISAAFFSTQDAVDCQAFNPNNPVETMAAALKSDLVNYHLQNSIPWFKTLIGGLQDAATQGVVISKQSWDYRERVEIYDEFEEFDDGTSLPTGNVTYQYEVIADKPKISLVPVENLRISSACDWIDPINTSPFLIELMPFYVGDLKSLMKDTDTPHGLPYRDVPDAQLNAAIKQQWDSIRRARDGDGEDRYQANDTGIADFNVVWVHRNFIRIDGVDMVYDTLGTEFMLSDPVPRETVYPTKDRPYIMGSVLVESHRPFPSSFITLGRPLQEEFNELANLRIDNIRLGISPRYFIRRNAVVDTRSLLRNVPGGITYVDNPQTDVHIREIRDVTRGSHEEANLLQSEMDDVLGTFSGASVSANRRLGETVGGMEMLGEGANELSELAVRTVVETWVEGVMKQLIELIQALETDKRLMAAIGDRQNVDVQQAFRLMDVPVKPIINVGFGATNPQKRLERLQIALNTMGQFMPETLAQIDQMQVVNEVFGAVGFKDGARFFPNLGKENPEVQKLNQQLQQLQMQIETDMPRHETAKAIAQMREQTRIQIKQMEMRESRRRTESSEQLKRLVEENRLKIATLDYQIDQEQNALRRQELYIQKEALGHSIFMDEHELRLREQEAVLAGTAAPSPPQQSPSGLRRSSGPVNLPGVDKAGVLARGDYNSIPFEQG